MKLPSVLVFCVLAFVLGVVVDRFALTGVFKEGDSSSAVFHNQFTAKVPGTQSSATAGPDESEDEGNDQKFTGSLSDLVGLVSMGSWEPDGGRVEDALRSVGVDDIQRLVNSLNDLDDSDPKARKVRAKVFERFAELNPLGALELVKLEANHELKEHIVHRAFETLARQNLASAIAAFKDLGTEDLQHQAVSAMAEGIGPKDAVRLADVVRDLPQAHHFGDYFERWARRDPQAAGAYVLAQDHGQVREEWLRGVANGWARTDPAGAIDWIDQLSFESDISHATEGALHSIMRSDPETASKLLTSLASGEQQRDYAGEVAESWAQRDLEATREWVESLSPGIGQHALRGMVESWARTDPAAAVEYVTALPPNENLADAVHDIARQWARNDLQAAATWALGTGDLEMRRRALDGVANEWARVDPRGAADFVTSLPSSDGREELLNTVGHVWARKDLNEAAAWALTLPPDARSAASHGIMERAADTNPDNAVQLLSDLTADWSVEQLDNSDFSEIVGNLAERWSEHTPAIAANWAQSLPDGSELQRVAIENVADEWVEFDSMAASQWISELPVGELRDVATAQLVHEIHESDPASAFQWALSASDEGFRGDMMHDVLEQWRQIDPGAAAASLDAAAGRVSTEKYQELGRLLQE